MELSPLSPTAPLLLAAVVLDLVLGDPVYRFHPVRLMGRTLTFLEENLRAGGLNGYGGGILLFTMLGAGWVGLWSGVVVSAGAAWQPLGLLVHVLLVYSLIAMRDLLQHASAVEIAARRGDLVGAREAISRLVGRDTSRMDLAACRRAAIESISENLTDGFVSPLAWYAVAGVPGIVLFKVVSTMDSMVGYKTARYLRFGWCGARLDDLMNLLPARFTWLLIAMVALLLPGCSFRKALVIGWQQHGIVPGPNSGWSEAAVAGAIERRLIGPIWANGQLVADIWLGSRTDPEGGQPGDLIRAGKLVLLTGLSFAALLSYIVTETGDRLFH